MSIIKDTQSRIFAVYEQAAQEIRRLTPVEQSELCHLCEERMTSPEFSVRTSAEIVRTAIIIAQDSVEPMLVKARHKNNSK